MSCSVFWVLFSYSVWQIGSSEVVRGVGTAVSWQVTRGSTVKRMWMSVRQIPATTEACASSDPTQPITEHDLTSPAISATAKQLDSCAGASQALQVSAAETVHPVST